MYIKYVRETTEDAMELKKKELKKQYKLNIGPITSLLIGLTFFSIILLVTMFQAAGSPGATGRHNLNAPQMLSQSAVSDTAVQTDGGILAVVKEIDTENEEISLYDTVSNQTELLTYNGGTYITDKYGKAILMSQIPIGAMVDADYQKDNGKLVKMQISTKAWEYKGVNNLTINRTDKIMKIADTKYKYTDDLIVVDGDNLIPLDNLAEQDELTIRGYDETIWSITVTRGHGTVRLTDYENFLGDNITIGYEAMQQITENMMITVREGSFNLTVENGKYSATKNITVYRNKETVVSLGDLGPDAVRMGKVTFDITPFGADLFVDGELTSYANPVDLEYGNHELEVSLGGYTTYNGTMSLNEAGKTIKIDLPEFNSGKTAVASETPQADAADTGSTDGIPVITGTPNPNNAVTGEGTKDETDNREVTVDKDHSIIIQNPSGASVYLDGDYKGTSPGKFEKVIGTHVITFIEDGYETKSYTIEVTDDGLDTYFSLPDLIKAE